MREFCLHRPLEVLFVAWYLWLGSSAVRLEIIDYQHYYG